MELACCKMVDAFGDNVRRDRRHKATNVDTRQVLTERDERRGIALVPSLGFAAQHIDANDWRRGHEATSCLQRKGPV